MKGIIQHAELGRFRRDLREIAAQLERGRVSMIDQRPVLMFTLTLEDRDLIVNALRAVAEVVIDD